MRSYTWLGLLIGLCLLAASIALLETMPSLPGWYASLQKPPWTPPNWVFGSVWSILYLMMAVSAWLVVRRQGWAEANLPLALFTAQLFFNVAWYGFFFTLQSFAAALAEIVVLWTTIIATTIVFWQVSRPAGLLLLPYLAWCTFTAILNFVIWRLNG